MEACWHADAKDDDDGGITIVDQCPPEYFLSVARSNIVDRSPLLFTSRYFFNFLPHPFVVDVLWIGEKSVN